MKWVNIALSDHQLETYLLRDKDRLFFTFISDHEKDQFDGKITLSHLTPGRKYKIFNLLTKDEILVFIAQRAKYSLPVQFTRNLTIAVVPTGKPK